ncbi:hypothetical protein [Streptomyces sp. NPDC059894]|uniref:hypothetical protein n=1 Tax=unclassified Streptomyces TaxID=2593676 RepID=UPI00364A2922
MKTKLTAVHVALASALAVLVGAGGGYLIAETTSGDAVSVTWQNSCPNLVESSGADEAATRLVGSGDSVSSRSSDSSSIASYTSSCFVYIGKEAALIATAELAQGGDVETWEETLSGNKEIGSKNERQYFTVGGEGKGISAPSSAAIYLKCAPSGSKITGTTLSIVVSSTSSEDSTSRRSDVAEVAVSFAKHAQTGAHCSDPITIPDGAPNLSAS